MKTNHAVSHYEVSGPSQLLLPQKLSVIVIASQCAHWRGNPRSLKKTTISRLPFSRRAEWGDLNPGQPCKAAAGRPGGWPHSLAAARQPLGDANKRPGVLRPPGYKEQQSQKGLLFFMVGVGGLEPPASWSRTKHATDCATPRCRRNEIIWSRAEKVKGFSAGFLL